MDVADMRQADGRIGAGAPFRLDGRGVLVFGAGTAGGGVGNGRAAAVTYARHGARVLAIDVDRRAAEDTAHAIAVEGFAAEAEGCDVADPGQVETVVARALERWGAIDVVHNNVGLLHLGGALEVDADRLMQLLKVNVAGMHNATRSALPAMVARRRGVITNISSVGSLRYFEGGLSYMVSKAAVNALTTAIALEFAPFGIRCNAILPGTVDTPLARKSMSALADKAAIEAALARQSPSGRIGSPWDVADAALFLASDHAAYCNGVHLVLDGGATWRVG